MELNSFIKITNILKILGILLCIGALIGVIIFIKKIYILNNTYSKYEKSVVAEILDSKVITYHGSSKTRRTNRPYNSVIYKVYIKETNETIKIEHEFTNNSAYKNGEEILLSYYNLYDKNSDKYVGQSYSTKPLSYFNNGSFCGTSNNSYIFCDSDYMDKIISLKIDYPEDRIVEKDYIWFYTDSHNVTCKLSKISEGLVSRIKNRIKSIDFTETSLGRVYNFEDYSILNYGESLNDSLVLDSTSEKNIIDFITNIY